MDTLENLFNSKIEKRIKIKLCFLYRYFYRNYSQDHIYQNLSLRRNLYLCI